MNACAIFGSPSGEPNTTTNRPMPQQMCEKLWTLPNAVIDSAVEINNGIDVVATQVFLQVDAPGPLCDMPMG